MYVYIYRIEKSTAAPRTPQRVDLPSLVSRLLSHLSSLYLVPDTVRVPRPGYIPPGSSIVCTVYPRFILEIFESFVSFIFSCACPLANLFYSYLL